MSFFSPSFLIGAAAAALLTALPAQAQDRTGDVAQINGAPERVEVIMPTGERSEIGAPIDQLSISRGVRVDDLNLASRMGARELRERVRQTAWQLCNRHDVDASFVTTNPQSCYSAAVTDAMNQVDAAIAQQRRG